MKKSTKIFGILSIIIVIFIIFFINIRNVKPANGFTVSKSDSAIYYAPDAHSAVFKVTKNGKDISNGKNNAYCLQPRFEDNSDFTNYEVLDATKDSTNYYTTSNGNLPLRAVVYYAYNAPGWTQHSTDLENYYSNNFSNHSALNDNVYHTMSALPISYAFSSNNTTKSIYNGVNCDWVNSSGNYCDWNTSYGNSTYINTTVNGWANDIKTLLNNMYTWWNGGDKTSASSFTAYYSYSDDAQDVIAWEYDEPKAYIQINKSYEPASSGDLDEEKVFDLYEANDGKCEVVRGIVASTSSDNKINTGYYDGNGVYYLGWAQDGNMPLLDPTKTYCIYENKTPSDNYIVSYTEITNNHNENITYVDTVDEYESCQPGGCIYGRVDFTNELGTNTWGNTSAVYKIINAVNKSDTGYITISKEYNPETADDGESRIFELYESVNDSCNAQLTNKIATTAPNSTTGYRDDNLYYLGWNRSVYQNGGNAGLLELDKTYCIYEKRDSNNYIVSYELSDDDWANGDDITVSVSKATDSSCPNEGCLYGEVTLSSSESLKKTYKGISYYTENIIATNTKEEEFGHVEVEKKISSTSIDCSSYHFKYNVTEQNEDKGDVCTNNSCIAIYGIDNEGHDIIPVGRTVTFSEILNNGYARVYSDSNCQNEITFNDGVPLVKPIRQSNDYTLTNIGKKEGNYVNTYDKCLTVSKKDGSTDEIIETDSVTFELYDNNTCTNNPVATQTTESGIATFTGLTNSTYYIKEVSQMPGYSLPNNNCISVSIEEQTSNTCTTIDVSNSPLYLGFYKLKEDGTPLTEATFKVKNSSGKYIKVSNPITGKYNGCYIYNGTASNEESASTLSVNNTNTGLYCIAKLPNDTYTAQEVATNNVSYWFNNGTIDNLNVSTEIKAKQGDGSNSLKNNPYVITFYKTKDSKNGNPLVGTKFKIKEQGTDNYISVSEQLTSGTYNGCYVYNGIASNSASELSTDTNGRICVIRVKGNTTYEAIETDSGDTSYYTDGSSINITSSKNIQTKNDENTLVNGSYMLSFYKTKEDGTPLSGATFKIKQDSNYIKVDAKGTDNNYPNCYVYKEVASNEENASIMTTDSDGRICVAKVSNTSNYVAKEQSTGDNAYYVFENGEIQLEVGNNIKGKEASNSIINKPYLINFYKVTENDLTKVSGAEFILTDSNGKYVEVEGISQIDDYKGCYIYKGLSDTKTNLTKLVSSSENISNGISIGEVCIIRMPQGIYNVTETKALEYHTFGSVTTKSLETTISRTAMNNDNKFKNERTEFKFTKTVSDENGYDNIWKNMTTEELKKIPFSIYDSNDNIINVIKTGDGIYEYSGNTIDKPTGTNTDKLYLNGERNLYVYHLPKGTYKIKESECCCEDTCSSPSTGTCYGYYSPNYNERQASSYTFTINDCSTSKTTGVNEKGDNVCTTSISTQNLDNKPTEVKFTKSDFYSYSNPNETVKFENEEEISIFDNITFKVYYMENGQKKYVDFAKVGNIGTCKTEESYSEYRYVPDDTISSIKDNLQLTKEIHTCGGHIKITHLCRGRKYYIEEVSVPNNTIFTLSDTEEGRIREINLKCCQDKDDDKIATTTVIEDKPTKVSFEKRDSKYGYLINDETTTFKLYRCDGDNDCHPSDYATDEERKNAGIKLVKFNAREIIDNDEEDSGIEVYRMLTNQTSNNYVTELHPYLGKLVLRYLQGGYNYVLFETIPPKGYTLPNLRNRETKFTVSNATTEVEEIDVVNKPTSLLIKKYSEDGNLLPGASFRIYKANTCDMDTPLKDKQKELMSLKTIRDGVYENTEIRDTQIIKTCKDREGSICSDITPTLTLNSYVDTWANFDNSINQRNEQIEIKEGEILVQYLEYDTCYIIEEVEAPKGYSLPENEDDRFTIVKIEKDNYVVDTYKELVNKPTPFTFYKYDNYNNLIDGGEYKLQKLNNKKKYEDVTVTEEEIDDKLYYKVDETSENKTIKTKNGVATVYYLTQGQYRIVETKAPVGMELPPKEVNVSVFYVDENGKVTGNSIITNKPKTDKIIEVPTASSELIVNISTGMPKTNYILIFIIISLILSGLIYIRSKINKLKK